MDKIALIMTSLLDKSNIRRQKTASTERAACAHPYGRSGVAECRYHTEPHEIGNQAEVARRCKGCIRTRANGNSLSLHAHMMKEWAGADGEVWGQVIRGGRVRYEEPALRALSFFEC